MENSAGGEELDKICTCPLGRETDFDLSIFSLVCVDVDECSLSMHDCDLAKSSCVNTDGSYV